MSRSVTLHLRANRPAMEMAVFPIIKALFYPDGTEKHELIGTGFFFDSTGLFFSARHVFQGRKSALDREDAEGIAVYCVYAVNQTRKMVRRHIDIASIKTRDDTDIAAGYVEMNQFGRPDASISIEDLRQTAYLSYATTEPIAVGTPIWTVGYPLTTIGEWSNGRVNIDLRSDAYEGKVTKHYKDKRDNGLLSWPCYETDMEIKHCASGGPVMVSGSGGVVFAVNCAGTTPHTVSHVSSLAPLV